MVETPKEMQGANRTYIMTARRTISGLVLKWRNGERFVIQGSYSGALSVSTNFLLTKPCVGPCRLGPGGELCRAGGRRAGGLGGQRGCPPVLITLHGARRMALLDAASFASAAHAPDHMDWLSPFDGAIKLDGFAITGILTET
jgi:hypothetical protein